MWTYIIRRCFYAIPILIGVNLLTFLLFFVVNSPKDMAAIHLGTKYSTPAAIDQWIENHGYNKPLFYDAQGQGIAKFTDTLFYRKSMDLFLFRFGVSDTGRNIGEDVSQRMWPSLWIAVPALFLGLAMNIFFAVLITFFRGSYLDSLGLSLCVAMMSISGLFYIILGQYLIAKVFRWVPISGYEGGIELLKFVALPVMVSVISGLGAGARWYRSLLMEEVHKEYVRTAKAKGLSQFQVLIRHVLPNALIPILTGVVVLIPGLFMGSLLLESFFGIPGLGNYTIDAIMSQDFAIVRCMVYLGTVAFILGQLLTDISYTVVDPRVRLND
jgi:peptide/nickel transport system permease protein